MILYILFTLAILIVETYFFYIPLKEIKEIQNKKDKIILFIGIFLANILSTLIFNSSIFRYILYPILIFIILKIINNETRIYDFFVISCLIGFKFLIECLIAFLFNNNLLNLYVIFVFIMEFISIFFAIIMKNILEVMYNKISNYWDCNKKFYLRYFMLITFNSLILFFIYNLIKIKEVF